MYYRYLQNLVHFVNNYKYLEMQVTFVQSINNGHSRRIKSKDGDDWKLSMIVNFYTGLAAQSLGIFLNAMLKPKLQFNAWNIPLYFPNP